MNSCLVVSTGIANVCSVGAAFARMGVEVQLSTDRDEIAAAPRLVLPGVGSFGEGMKFLEEHNLADILRLRIEKGMSTLAICVGMQLLCEGSEESPGVTGLGIVPGFLTEFKVNCPQLGWNLVEPAEDGWVKRGYAYFANSFRLCHLPQNFMPAWADHEGRFVAALKYKGTLATQFHPEISAEFGAEILKKWWKSTC